SVDGEEMEFSDGFGELHTHVYRQIIGGRGFGLDAVRPSVELAAALRNQPVEPQRGERHPMMQRHLGRSMTASNQLRGLQAAAFIRVPAWTIGSKLERERLFGIFAMCLAGLRLEQTAQSART